MDPSGLEEVFQKYRHSKGPFYLALAQATQRVQEDFSELSQAYSWLKSQRKQAQEELEDLETQRQILEEKVQASADRAADLESQLAGVQGLLGRAELLQQQGLGNGELDQLYLMLCQIAESHSCVGGDAVREFFRLAERVGQHVSLELEISQAEARAAAARESAEQWVAEARRFEAQTLARQRLIPITESLLEQGATPESLLGWEKILRSAKTTVEELDLELEQFRQLASLSQERQRRADGLQRVIARLESEVKGLRDQRSRVQAELRAIRDRASAELKKAGQQALRELKDAGSQAREEIQSLILAAQEYAQLREESVELREYGHIARSIRSDSPEVWQSMPRQVIQQLVLGAALWTHGKGCNPELRPPTVVLQTSLVPSWTRVSLRNLLLWSLSGVFSPEERNALSSGP